MYICVGLVLGFRHIFKPQNVVENFEKLTLNKNMRKKIFILTILSCFVSFSCKKDNSSSEIEKNENTLTENQETEEEEIEIIDFPLTDLEINFKNHEEFSNIDGPSMDMIFTIENKTPNKISNFEFQFYLKAIFENGEVMYFPNTLVSKHKDGQDLTDNDELIINNSKNSLATLKINETWEPNVAKKLEYSVGQYMPKGNFNEALFKRTPQSFLIVYSYNAISIDKEYNRFGYYDILDYWKEYQTQVGLR